MKVSRIRTNFAWDSIFHTSTKAQLRIKNDESLQNSTVMRRFLDLFKQIQTLCSDGGKEGKFQTFICVLLRDGGLTYFLPLIRDSCTDIYNGNDAFIYDQAAATFLEQMNGILQAHELVVDESLTKVCFEK